MQRSKQCVFCDHLVDAGADQQQTYRKQETLSPSPLWDEAFHGVCPRFICDATEPIGS
jgi:hypothetical protein